MLWVISMILFCSRGLEEEYSNKNLTDVKGNWQRTSSNSFISPTVTEAIQVNIWASHH